MWEYDEANQTITAEHVHSLNCVFCDTVMLRLPAHDLEAGGQKLFFQIAVCQQCGWWTVYKVHQGHFPRSNEIEAYSGSVGCLKHLDLTDISMPLTEVRQYFLAKRDSMLGAHPKILEDVVCSIFRDEGWLARVTAYSGDDGIDVILNDPSGGTIGVQVKRYAKEKRIEAEQIRSLTGAMLLGGHTKGVFIATTKFRRGAYDAAKRFTLLGYPVELVDADNFLERLGIVQQKTFQLTDERLHSYLLRQSVHLGSGIAKEFVPGEDLLNRPIIASAWSVRDLRDAVSEYESDDGTE